MAIQRVGHCKGQPFAGQHKVKQMQTTKLDPTLKRIGSKLREAAAGVVEAPLTARMTDLLARLSTTAPDGPPPTERAGQLTKKR